MNDMDPSSNGNPFADFPVPYLMELQLFVQVHPCFKAYILPGNGDYAYKGHICNIKKDITTYLIQPSKLDDMPNCIVEKELGPGSNNPEYGDFKVRRNVVYCLITT